MSDVSIAINSLFTQKRLKACWSSVRRVYGASHWWEFMYSCCLVSQRFWDTFSPHLAKFGSLGLKGERSLLSLGPGWWKPGMSPRVLWLPPLSLQSSCRVLVSSRAAWPSPWRFRPTACLQSQGAHRCWNPVFSSLSCIKFFTSYSTPYQCLNHCCLCFKHTHSCLSWLLVGFVPILLSFYWVLWREKVKQGGQATVFPLEPLHNLHLCM